MTMHPQALYGIPAETERVARAAFPKGSVIMRIADEIGMLMTDRDLAHLYPNVGQVAIAPSRMLMVTIFQFIEGLTDRQAADAVRRCIDWKYALALELTDPGFDASVLSEFRTRLLVTESGVALLEQFLTICRERGLVKARGKQRTDATHVLSAIRTLNRLECLGETLAYTLQGLLWEDPEWAQRTIPAPWWPRYQQRFTAFHLPTTASKREALAVEIGADGRDLLTAIADPQTPVAVREHPRVAILRRVWMQQFYADDGPLRLRTSADLPPAAVLISSPYDPDARRGTKRGMTWQGYKTHLTETCDADGPNVLTDVQTTPATTADVRVMPTIHAALVARDLQPAEHLVDSGYLDADIVVQSQSQQVEVIGPVPRDSSWQAQADAGFDLTAFVIDWERQQARCPRGHTSQVWSSSHDTGGKAVIHIQFASDACGSCADRGNCTRAASGPRTLKLRPQAQHEALQTIRTAQKTPAFQERYKRRAGIEGTISQGVHGFDLRYARYRGLAKTALQQLFVALAINCVRLIAWLDERPKAQTRSSRFTAAFRHADMEPLPIA